MKYNLKEPSQALEAHSYLSQLIKQGDTVDIKKYKPPRSLRQNNYLHLLLGAFGEHFGYTIEEAKTIYKREVNPSTYVYEKNGSKFLRSSVDLDTAEMTKTIDCFRDFSKEHGLPLPAATDKEQLMSLANSIERAGAYL
jgi:hypothetical protein